MNDDGKFVAEAYKLPFVRYMLLWRIMPRVKTLIIGQDPYRTDIFPGIAPAFSYDIGKNGALFTASVEMFVEAMRHQHPNMSEAQVQDFVRCITNSHRLLRLGWMIINASYNYQPMDREKVHQMVMMAEVIREVVTTRPDWKSQSLKIFAFGSLSHELASMISSSLNKDIRVTVTRLIHPAALTRMTLRDRIRIDYFSNVDVVRMLDKMSSNYVETEIMSSSMTSKDLMVYINNYTSRMKHENNVIREGLRTLKEKIAGDDAVTPMDLVELIGLVEEGLSATDSSAEFIGYAGALLHSSGAYSSGPAPSSGGGGGEITRNSRGKIDTVRGGGLRGLAQPLGKAKNPFVDSDDEETKDEEEKPKTPKKPVSDARVPSSNPFDSDPEESVKTRSTGRRHVAPLRNARASPFGNDSSDEEDHGKFAKDAKAPRVIDPNRYTEADDLADELYLANLNGTTRDVDLGSVASSVAGQMRIPADFNHSAVKSAIMLISSVKKSNYTTTQGKDTLRRMGDTMKEIRDSISEGSPYYVSHTDEEVCTLIGMLRKQANPVKMVTDKLNEVNKYIHAVSMA